MAKPDVPYYTGELREQYLRLVTRACAAFIRVEDLILDLEDCETGAFDGRIITTVKEFQTRMKTLEANLMTSVDRVTDIIDSAIRESYLILLATTTYRQELRDNGLTEADERVSEKVASLHVNALKRRARIRERRKRREGLLAQRSTRVRRSVALRNKAREQHEEETAADQPATE